MIPVKVLCGCGQKYSFEVEPVNGRMPSAIACPVCGADGTTVANQVIAQTVASQPPAPLAPPPAMIRPAAPPPPTVAPPSTRPTAQDAIRRAAVLSEGPGGPSDNWKWWYYVLAGVCIGGYSIWQAYDSHSIKPLGE